MRKNKLTKFFSAILTTSIFSGFVLLTISSESDKTVNKIKYNNKLSNVQTAFFNFKQKNKKIFSRQSTQKFSNSSLLGSNNNNVSEASNVNVKIFLDLSDTNNNSLNKNVQYYEQNNNKYLKEIISILEQNNIKVNSSYVSKLSPIIWINIDSLTEKKTAELLEKLDFILLIINNLQKTSNTDLLPTYSTKSLSHEAKTKIFYDNYSHAAYYYSKLSNSKDFFRKEKEIIDYNYSGGNPYQKVGVVEADMSGIYEESDFIKGQIPEFLVNYYNIGDAKSEKTEQSQNDHATLVSGIIAGTSGFSSNSNLYIANLGKATFDSPVWMSIFEKLIIENGVRIINHSYGFDFIEQKDVDATFQDIYGYDSALKNSVSKYIDHIFYLDFLSRKYGVVNIFSAGNEYDSKWKNNNSSNKYGYISGYANAINSIVVGSSFGTKENFYASNFSNRLLPDALKGLPKPFISAPGENIIGLTDQKSPQSGTSFSAPIVTGIVSTIVSLHPFLFDEKNIIPAIMSVLSSSAIDSSLDFDSIRKFVDSTKKANEHENITSSIDNYLEDNRKKAYLQNYENEHELKSSGFDSATGAGQINFANIEKAVSNLKTFSVSAQNDDEYVYTTPEIKLNKGDRIKASLAWAFNAGLTKPLKKYENQLDSWFYKLFTFGLSYLVDKMGEKIHNQNLESKFRQEYHPEHHDEWLNRKTLLNKQDNRLFSDYDLILQKKYGSDWKNINLNSGSSASSNVELIRHLVDESGIYRLLVKKYKSSLFEESIDDNLAVSYVAQKK
ncbi:S8 family serine peptidase [Mycoplasma sp. 'Moose RK']|uniref:S8 family serine peptidase n=1 Tax=Mycoplasma sp. 'Moose RK' TaxID=2780095 RepID=UPI0018C33990|nr:S8 family serine peptidase [Mycoplasma sp. 'Moose RK']MBG0730535.1 S8 family serine peptidase [Mycoplasma sp. 'Moose RK']